MSHQQQTLNEINDYMKEYLRHHKMFSTLEQFETEIKSKQIPATLRNDSNSLQKKEPRMHALFKKDMPKSHNELNLEKDLKELTKKYNLVIQAARQIFAVSINLIQTLLGVKDVRKQFFPIKTPKR
jgi:hypothetical protein